MANRKEMVRRPITFQARGISSVIAKGQQLKTMMGVLNIIAQNDVLMQAFLQKVDVEKLINLIFSLSGIDLSKLTMSAREKMVQSLAQPMQQAQDQSAGAAAPAPPGQQMVNGAASALGVAK